MTESTQAPVTYRKGVAMAIAAAGTANEIERYAAGVLPEESIRPIIEHFLWQDFQGGVFRKRQRIDHESIEELAVMRGKAQVGDTVTFEEVEPADSLKDDEWDMLKRIKGRLKRLQMLWNVQLSTFWVVAHCGELETKIAYARISVDFEGKKFKLDLCLS